MQRQDEPYLPTGRKFSLYGDAVNGGKGALFHGAFWAVTGFVSCAAANRLMNRRAMTWPWIHALVTMAGYSFGSSYGEWSRDTSTWLQRQRDAVSRLPMWAQVVDDAGESISDGSLQMARLNRLRQAIVAADEAEFLAQGMPASEVDAFLAGLVSRTGGDGTTAREVLSHPDDAVVSTVLAALGDASAASVGNLLAIAGPAARAELAKALRPHALPTATSTQDREVPAELLAAIALRAGVAAGIAAVAAAAKDSGDADASTPADDAVTATALSSVADSSSSFSLEASQLSAKMRTLVAEAIAARRAAGTPLPAIDADDLAAKAAVFADALTAETRRFFAVVDPASDPEAAAEVLLARKDAIRARLNARIASIRKLSSKAIQVADARGDPKLAASLRRAQAAAVEAAEVRLMSDETMQREAAAEIDELRASITRTGTSAPVRTAEVDVDAAAEAVASWTKRWSVRVAEAGVRA
ncbi:hypothetical protein FNF29_04215 [Cafeteria roenbergensis]|uniref:Uncharacterized protein n=1 Tax=Cafeteria roenbergensis TaxID=33653 RepID=A0A5A8DY22_CAFRO|nr:hypothetical protein FNF29_04215 [Cafeteria roenbergensis]KAA0166219.1 hypothetical protein FNF31_01445 [Cafeteria roenbergensis]KAA0169574.1 hypothetical protein FNF28_02018 [Cafeteria roenbergensis]|eukprot:KAA0152101.1 hypothetical protein FNF29_04215 [Cafeteria roenbergensis]